MKLNKLLICTMLLFLAGFECASARNIKLAKKVLVGEGIAKFEPKGFNAQSMVSFALKEEPEEIGKTSFRLATRPHDLFQG